MKTCGKTKKLSRGIIGSIFVSLCLVIGIIFLFFRSYVGTHSTSKNQKKWSKYQDLE